jgi:tRNA(adenine34) deaminase
MTDEQAMQLALVQAGLAAEDGEIPVGAVVLKQGELIAIGRNAPIKNHDPTAHAEISALRAAALALGNYRLDDCELFVTLEPCAMCAGAVLHSRLKRVVFGASDPKTGAAGSVLNLFAEPRLNHHTQVLGGVLAKEGAALLQNFFQKKRKENPACSSLLREDALRTPPARFANLVDYPWAPNFMSDLPSLNGLRLHYLDEGPHNAARSYLCLHASPVWSYCFRHKITELLSAGHRVLAPDLIGFGKSDKPKKESAHTLDWHEQVLNEWVERLDLNRVVLLLQDTNVALGLLLAAAAPERFLDFGVLPPLLPEELQNPAYDAPFPDRGHRAAQRALS